MKVIHDPSELAKINDRLEALNAGDLPKWGKMNPNEMLCHCADQIRIGLGVKKGKNVSNIFKRTIAKWTVFYLTGFPKTGVKTLEEMKIGQKGTDITEFGEDLAALQRVIQDFFLWDQRKPHPAHPYFGFLSHDEWGRVIWLHLDHHLTQFGR